MNQYYCYFLLGETDFISIGFMVKARNPDVAKKKFYKRFNRIIKRNRIVINYCTKDFEIELL